jgi:uncharacterized protein YndB with AHSA1/START domain
MKIDPVAYVGAVVREVAVRDHDGKPARAVIATRSYDTDIVDLWDALTNPERIPRWFLPVSGELRVGGRYALEGNASGTIERCDPPKSFFATWEYGGEVSWIELRLTSVAEARTRFELEHIAHVDDERWAEFGPGAVGVGWDLGLMGLGRHLESGAAVDRAESMAWMMSEEGRRFVTSSSEAWGRANAAAGEPEERARAAAERTTAAYTTPPAG